MPNLIVLTGPTRGCVLPVERAAVIGRGRVDLRLPDDLVSVEHAEVLARGGRFELRDLDSTNGTYLNGARVARATLSEGDIVHVGVTELLFTDRTGLDPAMTPSDAFRLLGQDEGAPSFDVRLVADTDEELVLEPSHRGSGLTLVLPLVHRVERGFSEARHLDELVERVGLHFARAVGGRALLVLLRGEDDAPRPALCASVGPQGELHPLAEDALPVRESLIERAFESAGALLGRAGDGALALAIGLPHRGGSVGVVYVHDAREALTQEDLRPLLLIAKLAGVHCQAHLLVAQLVERNAQLERANAALEEAQARLSRWNEELQAAVEARTAALQSSEARYRSLFHESRDGNFTVDPEGRLQELGRTAAALLGLAPAAAGGPFWPLLGEGLGGALQEQTAALARRSDWRAADQELGEPLEAELHTPAGRRVVEVSVRPLVQSEQLRGFHGIIRDVTARKEAEERMRLLSRIVDNVPEAVVTVTLDGVVTSWNPGAEALYRYSAGEVLGQLLPTVPDDRGAELERALAQVAQGTSVVLRTERVARDDEVVPVLATFAPVPGSDGAVVGLVELARDLRDQLELEERMRWRERLASFGELAAGLAHELGNPLSNLKSGVEYLLDRPREREVAEESLGMLQTEIERLQRLVQQTLDLARWRVPSLSEVDPGAVLGYVAALVRDRAAELGVELAQDDGGAPVRVLGHSDQLKQALLNLVSNALAAMPGGGRLELSVVRRGAQAGFAVRDTGCGIAPEDQERVFDLFYSRSRDGSGIGLAVVKRIVDLHQGRVLLESELGQGTTVSLLLPRVGVEP